MKIYTKTGDKGKTTLLGGGRIHKCEIKIESYGNIDELNSWMGYVSDSLKSIENISSHFPLLKEIQNNLFNIGSWLSLNSKRDGELYKLKKIEDTDIEKLEREIDLLTEKLPLLKNFILPGGHEIASRIHIARTVCRRAERGVVSLSLEEEIDNNIVVYLNRLSDYLFTLARYVSQELKVEEILWN